MDSVQLPDGSDFAGWEPRGDVTCDHVVDPSHPAANDTNPGTADRPLRTLAEAVSRVRPGERVLAQTGVFRECLRPVRGGTGPDTMVRIEAAPGARVVITGANVVAGPWERSERWRLPDGASAAIWAVRLPRAWFQGENPFTTTNRAVESRVGGFDQSRARRFDLLVQRCGMVWQDGQRLQQVNAPEELAQGPGRFWPDPGGLMLYVRPLGDSDPSASVFEATARRQCLAPDVEGLGYIAVRGLTLCGAGDQFPFLPQEGALSTNRGHHWIVEDCLLHDVNAVGMDLGVRDPRMALPAQYGGHIVRRNVVRDCGVCGIAGLRMPDCLVEDNLVEDCCYHDIEEMWESAGIKLHHCEHTVVRRNVVRRIPYGTGIWLDYDNRNMRCTGNTVTQVSSLFGGLFVEASRVPNLVDHNIVVGVHAVGAEGGHGLYAHDTEFLRVEHNLFADCAGCAIYLPKGQADRFVCGRGSCSRGHHVAGNLAVARGGRYLAFQDAANVSTANAWGGQAAAGPFRLLGADEWLDLETWGLFHGLDQDSALVTADAALDPETLELRLTANGLPRNGEAIAGPFPEMPERPVCVDPRVMRGR